VTTLDEVLSGAVEPGVYTLDDATAAFEVDEQVGRRGWQAFHLDGTSIVDKESFLSAIAAACRFPAWFGHNWDALTDALTDLSWTPAPGYVLLYDGHDRYRSHPDWVTVLEIFREASTRWAETGTPFSVLLR
jgi:RNAse (barnase) inhibitor barstar